MSFLHCIEVGAELATINRFSKSRLNNPENVLEHSGFVTLMAYFIGNAINNSSSPPVSMELLLRKAITHDVEEYVTGDVQRPTKHSSQKMLALFEELSLDSIHEISNKTDCNEIINDWQTSKVGYEGTIVAFCDVAAVVYKAYDEVYMRGNKTIQFGSPNGLMKLLNKYIEKLEDFGVSGSITLNLWQSCKILIDKTEECLK